MIKFHCRVCMKKLGVPDDYAHKRVRCPECQSANVVPDLVVTATHPEGAVKARAARAAGQAGWYSSRPAAEAPDNGEPGSPGTSDPPQPHPVATQPERPVDPGETVALPSVQEPAAHRPHPARRPRRYRLLRTCGWTLGAIAGLLWLGAALAPVWTLVQIDLAAVTNVRLAWWLTAGASGGMVLGGIGCFAAAQGLFVLRDLAMHQSVGHTAGGT